MIMVFLTVVPTGCDSKSSDVLPIFSSLESFGCNCNTGRDSLVSVLSLFSSLSALNFGLIIKTFSTNLPGSLYRSRLDYSLVRRYSLQQYPVVVD